MSYFLNVIVLVICVAIPFYWEGWHEGFCEVDFLCYRGEPDWLGYMVFGGDCFVCGGSFNLGRGLVKVI